MPLNIQFFPEGFIALQKELSCGLHPKLEPVLSKYPADELILKIMEVATYVGIVLDGTYAEQDFNHLCFILAGRLEVLREIPQAQKIIPLS